MIEWTILVADNGPWCETMAERLRFDGYAVVTADTAAEARELLRTRTVDLAVLDLNFDDDGEDMGGLEIALNEASDIPSVIVTSYDETHIQKYFTVVQRHGPGRPVPAPLFKSQLDPTLYALRRAVHDHLVPRVFVVHGHDTDTRDAVVEKLEWLNLDARVLDTPPGEGILDRFRAEAARAQYAVVVLTGDDQGASRRQLERALAVADRQRAQALQHVLKPRARQNVIFELGYFVALLGMNRVMVLYEADVELPSDYGGVGYVPLDEEGRWKDRLADALRRAGVERKPYAGPPPLP